MEPAGNIEHAFLRAEVEAKVAEYGVLVQKLLARNEALETEIGEYKEQLEKQKGQSDYFYDKHKDADGKLKSLQEDVERGRFILVLIDGDNAVFTDDFLLAGKSGAPKAAHKLTEAVYGHLEGRKFDVRGTQVVVKMFSHIDGLAEKLRRTKILPDTSQLHSFLRVFTMSQPMFEVVDVGRGKEMADWKVRETFRMMVRNVHCMHIFFAGCHDNGYVQELKPFERLDSIRGRLTLLETTPATTEYQQLGFDKTCFQGLFRRENLPADSPTSTVATRETKISIQPISTSNGSDQSAVKAWRHRVILLNQKEERLDEILPKPVAAADKNLKHRRSVLNGQNYCAFYHLDGACSLNACGFQHGAELTSQEKLALTVDLRNAACKQGSACRNMQCWLGHVCPRGADCTKPTCFFTNRHPNKMDMKPAYRMEEGEAEPKPITVS